MTKQSAEEFPTCSAYCYDKVKHARGDAATLADHRLCARRGECANCGRNLAVVQAEAIMRDAHRDL